MSFFGVEDVKEKKQNKKKDLVRDFAMNAAVSFIFLTANQKQKLFCKWFDLFCFCINKCGINFT